MKFLILILTSHDVYVHSQIQFEEWQDSKMCNIIINDDSLYEGTETFSVEIFQPIYTLLGRKNRATVSILDSEDGGSIVFLKRSSKAENFLLRFYSLMSYPKKLLIIKAFVFQNPSSSSISLSITSVKMMDIFMLPFQDQVI